MLVLASMTLSDLLTNIGSIFTAFIGYVGDIAEAITGTPLLLLGISIPIAFAIVSFVRRLFNF